MGAVATCTTPSSLTDPPYGDCCSAPRRGELMFEFHSLPALNATVCHWLPAWIQERAIILRYATLRIEDSCHLLQETSIQAICCKRVRHTICWGQPQRAAPI